MNRQEEVQLAKYICDYLNEEFYDQVLPSDDKHTIEVMRNCFDAFESVNGVIIKLAPEVY